MNSEKVIKQNGFNLVWSNHDPTSEQVQDGFFEMRGWQVKAFDQLKAEPFMILNAPMGSGKSWLMCLLSAFKLRADKSLRCVIAVPQTIIASGFSEAKIQMPNGEKIHWQIRHNLCTDRLSRRTVAYFIRWLEQPLGVFSDRTILCTHATLVEVYKKLKVENRLYLLNNVLLWVDEAHHIKNIEVEGMDGVVINNGIGELVSYFLSNRSQNTQVGLTTASFFRGDRATLLTDVMASKFKRFDLPYDDYLRTMEHLKSFSFDFLICGLNYIKGVEHIIRSRRGKDIIYIPHPISQFSTGKKYQEVSEIIGIYGNISHVTNDGVIIVHDAEGARKILDLVNEAQRKQKKSYLDNPIIKKQSTALDAIVALGMFKEGANWVHADRCIIVGARTSLVDVIQMAGRLFRDAVGKSHVEVVQLLPFSLDQQDEDGFRENLNNYLKTIYASLILENILNPVKIKPVHKVEREAKKDDDRARTNWLGLVLPDDAKQLSLMEDVGNHLIDIMANNKETISDVHALYGEYEKIIPEILDNYGICEYKEEVAKQIWGTLARRSLQMQGISVENIDFEILKKTSPMGFALQYTSGTCDANTFEKLREAIALSRVSWRPFEVAREYVRALSLTGVKQWYMWAKNIDRPKDIPTAPDVIYRDQGWLGWGDFLGTGTIASQNLTYRAFEDSRNFIGALRFKNVAEWLTWAKTDLRPNDIPRNPDRTYKDKGWISWGDFLGTGAIATKQYIFKSFEEAKEFTGRLGITSESEWRSYVAGRMHHLPPIPRDIPRAPHAAYKTRGWLGWGDFLGTGNVAPSWQKYCSYEEACVFVHSLGLKRKEDWFLYVKGAFSTLSPLPNTIPASPTKVYERKEYGEKWAGLSDFLGTGKMGNQQKHQNYVSYLDAQEFAKSLKLKSSDDWKKYLRGEFPGLPPLPLGIPRKPDTFYKEFKWNVFLGYDVSVYNSKRDFFLFNDARAFVHKLGLRSQKDWVKYCAGGFSHLPKKPLEIPSAPQSKYKNEGWLGYKDWLGAM
jgi:hypothetical protein